MVVKRLTVVNIGVVSKEMIVFDKPLNLFFGAIKSGKSTLAINSIKLLFGGSFSNDLIKHGENAGYVELLFDRASISRKFYRDDNGNIKAFPIEFYKDNKKVSRPVDAIRGLVNPFLLDQDFLAKKSALERKRYFIELLDIDTKEIDDKISQSVEDTKQLKIDVEKFGEIELIPGAKPDLGVLKAERDIIVSQNKNMKDEYDKLVRDDFDMVNKINKETFVHNKTVEDNEVKKKQLYDTMNNALEQIEELKNTVDMCYADIDSIQKWLENPNNAKRGNIEPRTFAEPYYKSTTEIDEQISNAKVDELKYQQYQIALQKQEEKEYHMSLYELEKQRTKALRQEKIDLLKSVETGIDNLWITDEGEIVYDNTALDMLSTSQLINLKSDCMSLYPNELGIELQDRAESLGESIYDYIDKAKSNDLTILATIVSSVPAKNVPEDVGVFVVENGAVIERR